MHIFVRQGKQCFTEKLMSGMFTHSINTIFIFFNDIITFKQVMKSLSKHRMSYKRGLSGARSIVRISTSSTA